MVNKAFKVDLKKPLVSQVGHLGEAYQEWVHQPVITKEGPRFFASDYLEVFTRTVWWVVPIVWLPVICWFVSLSVGMGLTPPQIASTLVGGLFMWTFIEYTMHRFLFHMETKSYWANTLHYLLHGCHHKHPMDSLRLVFPPAATAILSLPVYITIKLLTPTAVAPTLFAGGLLGYVIYDLAHYYLHHGKPMGVAQSLKRYHMTHHYRVQNKGFGITSCFWDIVFGTRLTIKNL